jgi:hypothetical protein
MSEHPFDAVYVLAQIGWPALFTAVLWLGVRIVRRLDRRHPQLRIVVPEYPEAAEPQSLSSRTAS